MATSRMALLVALLLLMSCRSAGDYGYQESYADRGGWGGYVPDSSGQVVAESESVPVSRARRASERQGRATDSAGAPAPAESDRADAVATEPLEERRDLPERGGRLLVYTGTVVLAIYDVVATQDEAIWLVEEMGGYVSHRASTKLVLRVPAAQFREALEMVSALGDLLDQRWDAQDVSDEVRDLDIRLRNSLELRDRLEALLARAETVEEALKIEAELERITLEVERIRGQLQSFEDRIAFSTLEVHFRPHQTHQVPADEYLLPFQWLNQLGLESLFRSVRGRQ